MTSVFVHCVVAVPYAHQLAARTPSIERYAERSLVLARRGDVVCVPETVDVDYLAFLASLGLGPDPEDVVVVPGSERHSLHPLCHRILEAPETFEQLVRRARARGPVVMYPFITSPSHMELARALAAAAGVPVRVAGGEPRLVDYADRKDHMRAKAIELGLPVASGETIRFPFLGGRRRQDLAPFCDAVARHLGCTGRVLVRGASGTAGLAAFIIGRGERDAADVAQQIVRQRDNDVFLIEVMVDATASPNVQMHVSPEDGTISCTGVTEQRWSRPLAHAGNVFPCLAETAAEMVCWSYAFTDWLRQEGYAGVMGFDFVEYREPGTGRPRVLFAEVNPRVNGATFPLALLERLNQTQQRDRRPESTAFVSGTVETGARSFAELRRSVGHLFYSPKTGVGAVPYLSSLLPHGKYFVAMFGRGADEVADGFAALQRAGAGPS